jgi:hypothetical protein
LPLVGVATAVVLILVISPKSLRNASAQSN